MECVNKVKYNNKNDEKMEMDEKTFDQQNNRPNVQMEIKLTFSCDFDFYCVCLC